MNRRALYLAFLSALLGGVLILLYLKRYEIEKSGGERVKLLTAAKRIDAGAQITEEMVLTREVPLAYVEDRAIKTLELPKILGQKAGNIVEPGEILMWTDLAIARDEQRNLSSFVQPDSRAFFVRTGGDDRAFALIHPGDYVDVLATLPTGLANANASNDRTTIVLMQRVLVLSVGLDMGSELRSDTNRAVQHDLLLSLSVKLVQAEQLALASAKGRLSVTLRNPDDPRTTLEPIEVNTLVDLKKADAGGGRSNAGGPAVNRLGGK